jgi:indole-3-glycerol phosphate synthase
MALVKDSMAAQLIDAAHAWDMDALVEVHDEEELERALALDAELIGINNRNLKTFVTDIGTGIRLKPLIPANRHVVAESGLSTGADLKRLAAVGITSYLIGESLMRADDVETATHVLLSEARQ